MSPNLGTVPTAESRSTDDLLSQRDSILSSGAYMLKIVVRLIIGVVGVLVLLYLLVCLLFILLKRYEEYLSQLWREQRR